ncbi:MAG: Rab family GTPase [Candidatus Hodarchaeota archaeon]
MEDIKYKVCIFGDAAVGKTTLTHRFLSGIFKETYKLTIGMDFYLKKLDLNGKKIRLHIWDFAGEEKFRFLLPSTLIGAHGTIFMYDITRYTTLVNLTDWLTVFESANIKQNHKIPMILVGSKLDLMENRTVSQEEATDFANKKNFLDYLECSSKTGENVNLIFEKISKIMVN